MRLDYINLIDIEYGERKREDFGDLDDLARSIKTEGLICPIAVVEKKTCQYCEDFNGEVKCEEGLKDNFCEKFMLRGFKPYILAAGGRRLAAHKLMEEESIACNIYDHPLNQLELRTIELIENIKRKQLTYDEDLALKAEIQTLMVKIHGPKVSTLPDAPGHSQSDTAKLLGITPASLSQDLGLLESMKQFPEVQWEKLKTKSDAKKLVKRIETSIIRQQGAKRAEEVLGTENTLKKRLMNSYMIGDFFEKVKEVPDNYLDLVEIDPPYAIQLQELKKDYQYDGYNEIDPKDYPDFMQRVFKECYMKMNENSWLICWFGPEPWFEYIYQWLTKAGFSTTRIVGCWFKAKDEESQGVGQSMQPSIRLASSFEMFYYAWKGRPKLNKPGSSNGFNYQPVHSGQKIHPTERPVPLIRDLLSTFGKPGAKLMIPFLGSGNSIIAGAEEKMIPFGFDLTQSFKDAFIIRVDELF